LIVDELKYLLRLDSSGFNADVNKADAQVDKLAGGIGNKLVTALKGAISAYALWRGLNVAADLAVQGEQVQKLSISWENLANSFGLNSQRVLAELDTMASGTVSKIDLMMQASKASIMGLPMEDLPKLMEISRAAALAFGQDVTFMFDSIVLGIARKSRLILDNLGIIIDEEELYKRTTKELGHELAESEKRTAYFNEALRQGQNIINRVGSSLKADVNQIAEMKASWDNTKASAALFFKEMASGSGILDSAKAVIEGVGKAFDELAGNADKAKKTIEELYNLTKDQSSSGDLEQIDSQILALAIRSGEYWNNVQEAMRQTGLNLNELRQALKSGALADSNLNDELYRSVEAYVQIISQIEKLKTKLVELKSNYDILIEGQNPEWTNFMIATQKKLLDIIQKQTDAISDQANRWQDLYNIQKHLYELQNQPAKTNQVFVTPLGTPDYKYLLPPPEMQQAVITAWQSFWEDMEYYLGRNGSDALQGAFDGILSILENSSNEMTRQLAQMANMAMDLAQGNYADAAFRFIDFISTAMESTDNLTENMRRWQEQTERNIEAISRMNDIDRQSRIEQLERIISWSNAMRNIWGVGDDQMDARIRYAQEELAALYENIGNDQAIRGIESFQELLDYFLGADDITFDQGRRLIDYFTQMFDLTIEQQIELYTQLQQILEDTGNYGTEQWMQLNEIIDNLNQTLEDQAAQEPYPVYGPDKSQIYRSVITITESQANSMQAILDTIHLDLQGIGLLVAQITKAITGNYNQIFAQGGGQRNIFSIGTITGGAASAMAFVNTLDREMRARGVA
jgi:hypothetical protein